MRVKPPKKKPPNAAPGPVRFPAQQFAAFDLLYVPVLGIEPGGTLVYANPPACKLFDHAGQGLPGMPLAEVAEPIIAGVWAEFWSALKGKGFSQGEAVLWPDSRDPMPISWRAMYFRQGARAHACLFIRPQDEPAPAEFDLNRDKGQLTRLVEHLGQPVMVLDVHRRIVYANSKASKLLALTTDQAAGKTVLDFLPQPLAGRVWEKEQQALDTNKPVRIDFDADFAGAPGNSITIIPFLDSASGRRHLILVFNRSGRREAVGINPADKADPTPLPIPVQQLRAALISARFLAVVMNRRNVFTWVNPAFAQEFGIDPAKPLEEEMRLRFGDLARWAEEDAQLMVSKRPVLNLVESIEGKGFFRKDKLPLLDENGEVSGVLSLLVPLSREMAHPAALMIRYQQILQRLDDLHATIRLQPDRRQQLNGPEPPDGLAQMRQLVLPYVDRLKQRPLTLKQRRFIDLIDKSLEKYLPPPRPGDSRLSPTEARVARLVRDGKTNAEIAALMGLSKSTVLTHRHHVRVKYGLKNKKVNLQTFLSEQHVAREVSHETH